MIPLGAIVDRNGITCECLCPIILWFTSGHNIGRIVPSVKVQQSVRGDRVLQTPPFRTEHPHKSPVYHPISVTGQVPTEDGCVD